jgi:hypothetical protein
MWPNAKYKAFFVSLFLACLLVNGGGKANPKKQTKAE